MFVELNVFQNNRFTEMLFSLNSIIMVEPLHDTKTECKSTILLINGQWFNVREEFKHIKGTLKNA